MSARAALLSIVYPLLFIGCADRGARARSDILSAHARIQEVRFKHTMVAIIQGAQEQVDSVLRRDPRVDDVTVAIDYAGPAQVPAASKAPLIVLIKWKKGPELSAGDAERVVRDGFVEAGIGRPEITRAASIRDVAIVEGWLSLAAPKTASAAPAQKR